jgi:hypothetical protein
MGGLKQATHFVFWARFAFARKAAFEEKPSFTIGKQTQKSPALCRALLLASYCV